MHINDESQKFVSAFDSPEHPGFERVLLLLKVVLHVLLYLAFRLFVILYDLLDIGFLALLVVSDLFLYLDSQSVSLLFFGLFHTGRAERLDDEHV